MRRILKFTLIILFTISTFSCIAKTTGKEAETKGQLKVLLTNEDDTEFDKYFKYFTDLLTPTIALIGLLITIPILRKKLLESHISKALIDIQDANKKLLHDVTGLIDEFTPKTFTNDRVLKEELEEIFEKIKALYKISQDGNSDSQTFLFFLKHTLNNTLKHYDPKKHTILSTREIYGLVIYCLDQVVFFSTQVVQIPKSTKTSQGNLINKKIKKYVSNTGFLKYKHFRQGLIDDANSAHFLIFYNHINSCSSSLLKRGAFQIFWNVSAIKKILFLAGIYAPVKINTTNFERFLGDENNELFLIGFTIMNSISIPEGNKSKKVELLYANPSDFARFAGSLTFEHVKTYKDSYIEDSGFLISKAKSLTKKDLEAFSLEFEYDYLKDSFKKNRRKFKKKLK